MAFSLSFGRQLTKVSFKREQVDVLRKRCDYDPASDQPSKVNITACFAPADPAAFDHSNCGDRLIWFYEPGTERGCCYRLL
jgi:hypothetical protein